MECPLPVNPETEAREVWGALGDEFSCKERPCKPTGEKGRER